MHEQHHQRLRVRPEGRDDLDGNRDTTGDRSSDGREQHRRSRDPRVDQRVERTVRESAGDAEEDVDEREPRESDGEAPVFRAAGDEGGDRGDEGEGGDACGDHRHVTDQLGTEGVGDQNKRGAGADRDEMTPAIGLDAIVENRMRLPARLVSGGGWHSRSQTPRR